MEKYITYVYDNWDHNPESQFGLTIHCTNGIGIKKKKEREVLAYDDTLEELPVIYIYIYILPKEKSDPPTIQPIVMGDGSDYALTSKYEVML